MIKFYILLITTNVYNHGTDTKENHPDRRAHPLGEFAPEFAHLNDDILFGEVVWADDSPATDAKAEFQKEERQVTVHNVTFEPGCRNRWHMHRATSGGGQVLIGVAGEGQSTEWLEEVTD